MMANRIFVALLATAPLLATSLVRADDEIPKELQATNYRITELEGIGYDAELARQDPSNVIKVGDLYYVWYTQRQRGVHSRNSSIRGKGGA